MEFEWDPAKNARNIAERGIDFATVEHFDWDSAEILLDTRRDYGESRMRALGFIGDRLHHIAFVLRGNTIRVISLRKANSREQRNYERKTDPG